MGEEDEVLKCENLASWAWTDGRQEEDGAMLSKIEEPEECEGRVASESVLLLAFELLSL